MPSQPDIESARLRTVCEFLDNQKTTVVAATDSNGMPWAVPLFYANDHLVLYWLTKPSSRLGAALLETRRAVVCVIENASHWQETKGLQMEGSVYPVASSRGQFAATRRYLKKHAALARQLLGGSGRSDVMKRAAEMRFFRFDPARCWFTDNREGFGNRFELSLNSPDES